MDAYFKELINDKKLDLAAAGAGRAADAVTGSPHMGAIFGGMLLSGRRAAEFTIKSIKSN